MRTFTAVSCAGTSVLLVMLKGVSAWAYPGLTQQTAETGDPPGRGRRALGASAQVPVQGERHVVGEMATWGLTIAIESLACSAIRTLAQFSARRLRHLGCHAHLGAGSAAPSVTPRHATWTSITTGRIGADVVRRCRLPKHRRCFHNRVDWTSVTTWRTSAATPSGRLRTCPW